MSPTATAHITENPSVWFYLDTQWQHGPLFQLHLWIPFQFGHDSLSLKQDGCTSFTSCHLRVVYSESLSWKLQMSHWLRIPIESPSHHITNCLDQGNVTLEQCVFSIHRFRVWGQAQLNHSGSRLEVRWIPKELLWDIRWMDVDGKNTKYPLQSLVRFIDQHCAILNIPQIS